jgi:hypothetical protein
MAASSMRVAVAAGVSPRPGAGSRPPWGSGWHLVGEMPPGQSTARAWIKERWPPGLGPSGDDVFDIEPRWRPIGANHDIGGLCSLF